MSRSDWKLDWEGDLQIWISIFTTSTSARNGCVYNQKWLTKYKLTEDGQQNTGHCERCNAWQSVDMSIYTRELHVNLIVTVSVLACFS